MDFYRARTKEQIEQRQLDIMKACEALFEKGGYDGVNMKAISEITTITRSSIYTYYKTKDEIILDLLREELLEWGDELNSWINKKPTLDTAAFCKEFTKMLLHKDTMLQYYTLLYTLLEINCRTEHLVTFKKDAIPVTLFLVQLIQTYFPVYTQQQCAVIAEQIMSYVLGLYPSTHLTQKQLTAVALSETGYVVPDFATLCEAGIYSFISGISDSSDHSDSNNNSN